VDQKTLNDDGCYVGIKDGRSEAGGTLTHESKGPINRLPQYPTNTSQSGTGSASLTSLRAVALAPTAATTPSRKLSPVVA
jgi:hypothetical protein